MAKCEYQPSPSYLRERAAFYRERARRERDRAKVAEYHHIASVLDHEADAFEGEEAPTRQRVSAPGHRPGARSR